MLCPWVLSNQVTTIGDLVEDWNSTLDQRRKVVHDHNASLAHQVVSGDLDAAAAVQALLPVPQFVAKPSDDWCKWFRRNSGWSLLSRGMENSQWLPYQHPDMEASRRRVREMIEGGQVHPALILNVDQVWRRAYDNRFRFLHKNRSLIGQRARRQKVQRTIDKKAHFIGGSRRSVTVPGLLFL